MPSTEAVKVGKTVAARVGIKIREARTKLKMTQAQLAAPEYSISYISAIERGKIQPSLQALSVLGQRLNVSLTFLLEGSPSAAPEEEPDQRVDVNLLQANVFVRQGAFKEATEMLAPIQLEHITTDQIYRLFLLQGQIHLGLNEYKEAVVDLRAAVTHGESLNDIEYIERARNLLGRAYFLAYEYTSAIGCHLRCNSAIENNQINDPIFSLDVFRNLADDYFRLGDLETALTFYHRGLEMLEGLNLDSKNFAQKYMEISQRYKSAGKLAMARDYAMRSLAVYEMRDEQRLIGLTHQHLGMALEKQENLDGAEQEYRHAIAIETELGDEVATLSASLSNVGMLFLERGDYTQAESLWRQVLEIQRKTLGENHPDVAVGLNNLAMLYEARHNYTQAEPLYREALAITHMTLGEEHPYFVTSLNNLASLYYSMGDYTQAEPLLQQAVKITPVTLGEEHPYFVTDLNKLAKLYIAGADYTQAEPLLQQAVAIQRRTLGEEHPDVAASLNDLEEVHRKMTPAEAKPRYANVCFVSHEDQTIVPKTANLEANKEYNLRLDIGLLSPDSAVVNAETFPAEYLPETEEGHWLEVVVVSENFTISRRRYNLFLPNSGASWVCNCPPGGDHTCSKDSRNPYLFIPLTAPERTGIARLRIAIYYEKNLIQSQFLTAQINGAEQKAGGYSSRIDYTLTADLRDVSFLPSRTLHILTNQNLDGTHRLIINGKSDDPLAFNLRDDQIGGAINGARQALRDVHMKVYPPAWGSNQPPEPENLLDEKNGKSKEKFIENLKSLANLGWQLCAMLSDQQDWQAKLQESATIQVSRTAGSTFVFPWALVYDIPLFTYDQAKLCPLVQNWDKVNTLIDTSTRRCPYESQHEQGNILCPFGFWGIKHIIEQLPSMPKGRALPLQIQAAHEPPEVVVGLSLQLNTRQTTDHLHALEMAHFKVLPYNSLKQIPEALKPPVEIVYFYCHGGRAQVPGTGQATPYLEVGVGGKNEQFQPGDITAWRKAVWPPNHWSDTSPLVFLNGCHTAELTPELLVNFVDGFTRAYAAGVIGTEITVLQPLASEAAVQFLGHFHKNEMNVGQALQQMRLHFLMKGNLLGLAYTPYCSADLHF